MHLSPFLKIFSLPGKKEARLLFSTKSCSLTLLNAETLAAVQAGKVAPETMDTLVRLGMAVADPAREQREMRDYLPLVNRLNPNLRVSVILGMGCNFACVYCYEGSMKGAAAMDDAVAEQLVSYLLTRFTPEKKRLLLDFYGGEPLLYVSRIKSLAARLKPLIEARGGTFEFTLVTNGSLLTADLAKELVALGLVSAKITVDGPEENHDRFRPTKNGQGSWAAILANLKACCNLFPIFLSGNYTQDNFRRFPELLDSLRAMGLGPEAFAGVQFYPVMQVNDQFANPEFSGGCCSMNEPWLVDASLFVREEILQRGYPFPKLQPAPCMVDLDDAFVVNHDGVLYKCVTLIGHQGYEVGDIWHGMTNGWEEKHCLNHWQGEEQCRECEYLPLCFGGCRYMAYQREGSMAGVDCQKDFLDATLERMLLQDLKYRYAAKVAPNSDPSV
ncbi:MAG: geopeptide radical SAM maturase [Desulfobulbaceae bacterium]|nr:geopeptide radical SAM maturase [Desulfobulbaceae bacterium]HIJ91403.1 putative geopeptide radical SAM maturase [Deltaproteobacteria bacterium]